MRLVRTVGWPFASVVIEFMLVLLLQPPPFLFVFLVVVLTFADELHWHLLGQSERFGMQRIDAHVRFTEGLAGRGNYFFEDFVEKRIVEDGIGVDVD